MVHGYHIVLPHYGFWLPNDPRGSWSDFVYRWELARFGRSTRHLEQRTLAHLSNEELALRSSARNSLAFPPVTLTGQQALSVANGFARKVKRNGYVIWACAVLPEHTHLVVARHKFKAEFIANQLKGAATRQLIRDGFHPLACHQKSGSGIPCMWADKRWKCYLDSESAIENAIAYVWANPAKEGKPKQHWSWTIPFAGVEESASYI